MFTEGKARMARGERFADAQERQQRLRGTLRFTNHRKSMLPKLARHLHVCVPIQVVVRDPAVVANRDRTDEVYCTFTTVASSRVTRLLRIESRVRERHTVPTEEVRKEPICVTLFFPSTARSQAPKMGLAHTLALHWP